jgi:serine protease SohB
MDLSKYTQVVYKLRISGVINGKTLEKVRKDLLKYPYYKPVALLVVVNSPGGSAAHSSLIYNRLVAFGKEHKIPIYSFAEDVAASGGYYAMCAGTSLYASSPLSLVGSIGAVSSFFSIKELINKYGIERRSWASSEHDLAFRFDPLKELNPDAKAWMQNMLYDTNLEFKNIVSYAREGKIKVPDDKKDELLFNGDVFNATKALELGLIDGQADCDDILDREFPSFKVVDVSRETRIEKIMRRFYD